MQLVSPSLGYLLCPRSVCTFMCNLALGSKNFKEMKWKFTFMSISSFDLKSGSLKRQIIKKGVTLKKKSLIVISHKELTWEIETKKSGMLKFDTHVHCSISISFFHFTFRKEKTVLDFTIRDKIRNYLPIRRKLTDVNRCWIKTMDL